MSSLSQNEWDTLVALTAKLTEGELIEHVADTLEDREVAYVIWDTRDFEAAIRAEFKFIPNDLVPLIAKTAYESARSELADTRAEDKIAVAISGAWHDYKLGEKQKSSYKMRLRHPEHRQHVEVHFGSGVDGSEAHRSFVEKNPDYKNWGLVSLSEA